MTPLQCPLIEKAGNDKKPGNANKALITKKLLDNRAMIERLLAQVWWVEPALLCTQLIYTRSMVGTVRQCMEYKNIITIEAGKRGGKPCIRGLRITVYDVLDCLANGMSSQEITEDFPELTAEDVQACLAFAADRERHIAELRAI